MQTLTAADVALMPRPDREVFLMSLSREEMTYLRWDWRFWARPKQLQPPGDWSVWVAMAGRGFGKALALDVPLATSTGWTTMADVQVGDVLFDERGQTTRVLGVHPVQHGRPCYRIEFSDGNSIVADEDHLWKTLTAFGRKKRGLTELSQVHEPVTTLHMSRTLKDRDTNHCIPCAKPLQLPEVDLPMDPYLLGLWLGDGSKNGAYITTPDHEVVQAFLDAGYTMTEHENNSGAARGYAIDREVVADRSRSAVTGRFEERTSGFYQDLRSMGLINNKHVPAVYLRASYSQRLELLRGLLDSDGECHPRSGAIGFCSSSETVFWPVLELVRSLGYKPSWGRGIGKYRKKGDTEYIRTKPSWFLGFIAHKDVPLFRVERKLCKMHYATKQKHRAKRRFVTAVVSVPSVPVRCITVDSPTSLFLAGEAMIPTHNTRLGAEWVRSMMCGDTPLGPSTCGRFALVAETAADARDVMVQGPSGILAVHPPEFRPVYKKSQRSLEWPNGAVALLFSAEEPDQLRGPEHDGAWFDELAKARYAREAWDMLQFGMRVGDNPRQLVTTTPRPIPVLRELLKDEGKPRGTVVTRGSTYDNAANLAPTFLRKMEARYEGTRLGRQELLAEVLDDVPGALWTRRMLDRRSPGDNPLGAGMDPGAKPPRMHRIVVGVDPSGTSGEEDGGDLIGIVVAGKGEDGLYYVLEDGTCDLGPSGWGRRVVDLYRRHEADCIVGETNYGGAMVEFTVRTVDRNAPFKEVKASRGKAIRAEPIASLYEQGRVRHAASLPELEDQLCNFTRTGYLGSGSPDRADALVWALTELALAEQTYDPEMWAKLLND